MPTQIKILDPQALQFFSEDQIVRSLDSPDIFLASGVQIPGGANQAFFQTITTPDIPGPGVELPGAPTIPTPTPTPAVTPITPPSPGPVIPTAPVVTPGVGEPIISPTDRLIGPTEFSGLVQQWQNQGLTNDQIEQFMIRRDAEGNIFLRGDAPNPNEVLSQFEDFQVDFTDFDIDSDLFEGALAQPTTALDINNLLEQNQKLIADIQQSILDATKPSVTEAEVAKQIVDLRTSFQEGLDIVADKPVPLRFITGQQLNLARQFTTKEANLLAEQGLAQDARLAELDGLTTQLGFVQQNQTNLLNQYNTMQSQAKGVFDTIIDNFKGISLQDLPQDTQNQLAQLAEQAGIPFALLSEGMEIVKQQMDIQNAIDAQKASMSGLPSSYKEWQLSNSGLTYNDWLRDTKGLDNRVILQVDKLSQNFDNSPIVKQFNTTANKKFTVDEIINSGVGGPGDLAIVFEFMKALDPTSVVRESEYAAASTSGNIFRGWAAKFNGYLKSEGGFLPDEVKNSFMDIVNVKFDAINQQYNNLFNETVRKINLKTGDEDGSDYLTNYNQALFGNDPLNILNNGSGMDPLSLGISFNRVTNQPTDINRLSEAIAEFESGGNYLAIGNPIPAGNRAYGKYQIMDFNIPSWTNEVLGFAMTPDEFLNNSDAQDQVARTKIAQLIDRFGNVEDVASTWFSGQPFNVAMNASDVNGTTVPQYVASINSIFNNLA